MSGRLIYRCGRFLDQGYVTFAGGGANSGFKRSDEEIWKAFRERKPVVGTSGHVWTVLSEGREVQEVLAFAHNALLSPRVEASITAKLGILAEKELPAILADIRKRTLAPSEARSVLNKRLDQFAVELSVGLPTSLSPRSLKQLISGKVNFHWKLIAAASIFLFLAVSFLAVFNFRGDGIRVEKLSPTREDIIEVAAPCYPEINSSSRVDELIEAFAGSQWRHGDSNTYDFLKALTEQQRSTVTLKDQRADDLCAARTNLWKTVSVLQEINATEVILSLDKTRKSLPSELGHGSKALAAMEFLARSLSQDPIPSQPTDCKVGLCLPLISVSEIDLTNRLESLYADIEFAFDVDLLELPYRLRGSEVKLRGELSLAGVSTTELLTQFAPFWECGASDACALPLRSSLDALGLEVR